ncbi:ABC transporter substrate-binding protein [Roseateles sp.]|uniref:ABC transporter substrate-binding protein n=1 Tax=Roseateles sp. TaxID=1971397 RepID=UPI0039EAFC7A
MGLLSREPFNTDKTQPMSPVPDILWYTRTPNPTPLGLASQLGWFHDEFRSEGIKIFTLEETPDPALRTSRLDHHLPNSFRQGGNVPAIWARSQGAASRVVGMNWLDEYQGIVCRPGSGLRSVNDLRGRRIGLPLYSSRIESRRSEALHGFLVALDVAGLAPSQVEFVDLAVEPATALPGNAHTYQHAQAEYELLMRALQRGDVDAIYLKGDRGLQLAHLTGARLLFDISRHPDPLVRIHNGAPRPITVHQSLLDEHPHLAARFLARIVAVEDWAAHHPDETLAYISRETGGEVPWVRLAYGSDVHRRQGTELTDTAIHALEVQKAFLLKWGFIQHDFDVQQWIAPTPLREARRLSSELLAQAL